MLPSLPCHLEAANENNSMLSLSDFYHGLLCLSGFRQSIDKVKPSLSGFHHGSLCLSDFRQSIANIMCIARQNHDIKVLHGSKQRSLAATSSTGMANRHRLAQQNLLRKNPTASCHRAQILGHRAHRRILGRRRVFIDACVTASACLPILMCQVSGEEEARRPPPRML